MQHFNEFGLPESLNHTLRHMQLTKPTPIQTQAIPPALEGHDILGSAQTGTGKTAAFGIPWVTRLLVEGQESAVVMPPTHELAAQVITQLHAMLGRRSAIKTALLIGGEAMPRQLQQLRRQPRLFVGTPGRINDHLARGSLKLHDTRFLVLDETDRMLDMGFTVQIERVMKFMPRQRQTLLFSATLPDNIIKISEKYLHRPMRITVDPPSSPVNQIKQDVLHVTEADKYTRFIEQLNTRDGSIIVFVKTRHGTARMAAKLAKQGHRADAIHGDLRQHKRNRVIANFRSQKYRILVATDVAARGLDIPHIQHVINYDLPQCADDYIHRIGRTARAGADGSALCLVTPADKSKWSAIRHIINPNEKQQKPKQHTPRNQKSGKKTRFSKHRNYAKKNNRRPRRAAV